MLRVFYTTYTKVIKYVHTHFQILVVGHLFVNVDLNPDWHTSHDNTVSIYQLVSLFLNKDNDNFLLWKEKEFIYKKK